MIGGIEVFECEAEDVDDSVKKLWLDLAREMFEIEHLIVPSEANGDKWIEYIRESLASGRTFFFTAKSGSSLVGFVDARVLSDSPLEVSKLVGVIDDVYVLPEFRRMGIGKKLVVECLNKMKVEGVKAVRLQVLTENEVALKFYEKLGFKTCRYGMTKQTP